MAGAAITIHTDWQQVLGPALKKLAKRAEDLTPVMQDIGDIIVASIQLNFMEHRGPDLVMWQALSKRYEEWKVKVKGRKAENILKLNDILQNSIHPEPKQRSVAVGTNIEYAAIHQFGGEIKKAARSGTLNFRINKRTGEVGNRFVKKSKSNFSQDVSIRAHSVFMPARPFIGIRDDDYPEMRDAIAQYIVGGMD